MLINLRNAMMAGRRLPYDAEVEFLESTGTQRIDTGIVGVSEWHITAQGTGFPSASNCVIATKSSGGSFWGAFRSYNYWAVGSANVSTNYRITLPYTSLGAFVVNFNSNSVTFTDGVETATRNSTPNFSVSFCLFSTNNDGYAAKVKIYGCKVYQNGTLVRDFIPVRKGTVGYLYDRVSGKLFGNAGTGDFVLGQDVVPVEWLQTDGAAYINTGLEMADGHEVQGEHIFKTSTARQLMGSNGSRQYYGVSADGYVEFGLLGTHKSTVSVDETKKYLISYAAANGKNTGSVYDGSTLLWSSSGAYNGFNNAFAIFRNMQLNGLPFASGNKIVTFKHLVNGAAIQNLIPVRVGTDTTSWEGAMMDVLTRRIYRNAGTGAFTYGNDLKYPIPAS